MKTPLPETRICRICGLEFKPKSRLFRCNVCVNELARRKRTEKIKHLTEIGHHIPYEDMIPEEMKGTKDEIAKKYRRLKNEILLMDREEYRDYLKRKLDEIMNNLPLWRYLTREGLGDTPPRDAEKKPKLSKRDKLIQRGDTRNMSWDEYESLGYGGDEDT